MSVHQATTKSAKRCLRQTRSRRVTPRQRCGTATFGSAEEANQAKGWFVTLPQCTLSKEYYLAAIHARYSLDEWLVAEEVHEDGSPHLHAFFKTVKKITWSPEMFTVDGFRGC